MKLSGLISAKKLNIVLLPVLALIGALIPYVIYGKVKGKSIVEDLRTNE